LEPAAASPMSENSTQPFTAVTSREIRKPEYMVSTMSVTTAAVPGTHPSLRPRIRPPSAWQQVK